MSIKICAHQKGGLINVRTTRLIPSITLIVPQGEVEDYKANNPKVEVVGVPSHIRGITHTRQWILDNWASEDVFMIDDDVVSVRKNYFYGEGSGTIDDRKQYSKSSIKRRISQCKSIQGFSPSPKSEIRLNTMLFHP
jgi:hypothetical protein